MSLRVSLALLLGLVPANADVPVHCLRHEVVGEWSFSLGPSSERRSSCGHLRPDDEDKQPSRAVVNKVDSVFAVTLKDPAVAENANDKKGNWTMVYDEGFEVNVDGLSFFAFSNFTYEPNVVANSTKKHHTALISPGSHNVSHCGQTMVGWYHNAARTKFGCYYGVKTVQPAAQAPPASQKAKASLVEVSSGTQTRVEKALDTKAQRVVVSKLNKKLSALNLGWKAKVVSKWNGRTMREVNSYAGIKRFSKTRNLQRDMLRQRAGPAPEARSFLQQKGTSSRAAPKKALPKDFDWSDVNGADYLEPVMDQADCGSCYAASGMRMLTARHKIKQNDTDAVPWSISFPLHCSEYNQGCKGGYGFLLSKWSGDVGLLPANCMRYNTTGSCKLECDLKSIEKRYRVSNHRYIGAFYGPLTVDNIKEELHSGGPVTIGIEPSDDFMFYSDGIYKSSNNKTNATLYAQRGEWEQVDHAVLLVGWGVEDGQEYWRVQNSWGPDWGEEGFFRIQMGVDESAIESMAEAADVIEDDQKGKQVDALFSEVGQTPAHKSFFF